MLSAIVLVLALILCLLMVAVGLPGTWMMLGAALLWGYLTPGEGLGVFTLVALLLLALVGELVEFWLSVVAARRYGGSGRAAWGAVIGGVIGGVVGLPIPVVGLVVGAMAGAWFGALVAELSSGAPAIAAVRSARGAFLGRVAGTAAKCCIGVLMAAWIVAAAL